MQLAFMRMDILISNTYIKIDRLLSNRLVSKDLHFMAHHTYESDTIIWKEFFDTPGTAHHQLTAYTLILLGLARMPED